MVHGAWLAEAILVPSRTLVIYMPHEPSTVVKSRRKLNDTCIKKTTEIISMYLQNSVA